MRLVETFQWKTSTKYFLLHSPTLELVLDTGEGGNGLHVFSSHARAYIDHNYQIEQGKLHRGHAIKYETNKN